ncbi:MAG: Uncharacterized protein XE08_0758 [Parcubacteria bacterium 32_520]|nr:MAG: Uncharacterized protein XE08_0758 [Parcubacteria bacterium 32_520]
MNTKKLTTTAIRKLGIAVITKELGPAGMIRFLEQYELGYGDYTKERKFISRERVRVRGKKK